MDKKNAIRSETVLNQNTVKVYTNGLKLDGRVDAGFYAVNPNNSPKQAFFHLGVHNTEFQAAVQAIPEVAKNLLLEKKHNQSIVVLLCWCIVRPWASARGRQRRAMPPWIFTYTLLSLPNFKNSSIFSS